MLGKSFLRFAYKYCGYINIGVGTVYFQYWYMYQISLLLLYISIGIGTGLFGVPVAACKEKKSLYLEVLSVHCALIRIFFKHSK